MALQADIVGPTFGAYLICTFIATMLYGVALHQAYRYARLFPTESFVLRALVIFVFILQTVHVAFSLHSCYYYLVSRYGFGVFELASGYGVWSLICIPLVVGMNMIASQLFFVRRVFLMGTYHRIFACAATICFVGELAIAVGITVLSFTTAPSSVLNQLVKALYTTASAGDTLITASLITGTYKSRKRASTTSTGTYERIGEFFVTYVINTGMIHNVLNIVALCLSPLEQTLYSPSLSLVITRVYFMTLLTVLNTRTLLVSRGINILDGGDRFGMNIIARAKDVATKEQWNVPQVPDAAPAMININVTTELESPDVGLVSCMSDSASFGDMMGKVDSRA